MHAIGKRFYARPILRWGILIAAAATVGNVVLIVIASSDAAGWLLALRVLTASYPGILLTWLGYPLLRYPAVQVAAETVEWRPLAGRRQRLLISEIKSTHWQDSFDLRLCTRDGKESSLRVGVLSTKSRKRLGSLFDGMFCAT